MTDSQLLIAHLKSERYWTVIANGYGKDGVARMLLWEANGSGGNFFEVRKSGELLLKTAVAEASSARFMEEVDHETTVRLKTKYKQS